MPGVNRLSCPGALAIMDSYSQSDNAALGLTPKSLLLAAISTRDPVE